MLKRQAASQNKLCHTCTCQVSFILILVCTELFVAKNHIYLSIYCIIILKQKLLIIICITFHELHKWFTLFSVLKEGIFKKSENVHVIIIPWVTVLFISFQKSWLWRLSGCSTATKWCKDKYVCCSSIQCWDLAGEFLNLALIVYIESSSSLWDRVMCIQVDFTNHVLLNFIFCISTWSTCLFILQIQDTVSEKQIGLMRIHYWRDAIAQIFKVIFWGQ